MSNRYAIIGVANRFPGSANTPQAFWDNLISRRDCISRAPADRWNADVFTSKDKDRPGKTLSSNCGFIDGVYEFDYEAFGISKREAEQMDPQQKVLLEVSLQALEDAGIRYQNSKTGVFVGIGQEEQFAVTTYDKDNVSPYSVTGSALSIASNRISFVFNLHGPSLSVDTACSSAVTAMHLALNALDAGQCEQALVGGVNLLTDPSVMIQFSKLGVLAPDSKCKSFDASANGYVRAEGCGVVVLKRFEAAVRDGDHIYCVVRGSAINSDGKRSPSLTMPSAEAQKEVFRRAATQAHVNPQDVFFVEAHATGTKVGDPTEANAIGEVFGGAARAEPLRLGAVKTNVGHLECASFMAGLIKSVLMLDNQTLLPNINFSSPNPDIKFDLLKMKVQTDAEPFHADGKLVAISSFGFGGSNGCCILEGVDSAKLKALSVVPRPLPNVEYPVMQPPYLFVASAETTKALDARVELLKKSTLAPAEVPHLASTLLRREMHRYVSFGLGETPSTATFSEAKQRSQREPLVWVFAGQGPQHENMGRQLYEKFPVFRESIEASDRTYAAHAGFSLVRNIGLFGPKVEGADPNAVFQLKYTLPSLIFLQIALVDLWTSFGVRPDVVVGHSFGEMAAAYASGVCSREQIVETAFHRAKLLEKLDGRGTMVALGCGEEKVMQWLHSEDAAVKDDPTRQVWVAAYNSVDAVTVGGTHEAVAAFSAKCKEANIWHRVLKINSAYHTPVMNPVREEALKLFSTLLAETYAPNIPFYSTVEARFFNDGEKLPTSYMWSNIEQPVRFRDAVTGIVERFGSGAVFMEMSAHPVLSAYIKHPSTGAKNAIFTLHREQPEQNSVLQAVAQLLVLGRSVDSRGVLGHTVQPIIAPALRYPLTPQHCHKESRDLVMLRTAPEGSWKPLLGRRIPHPETEQLWTRKISIPHHLWIADHVVQETVVFPGAGYVEMALEAFGSLSVSNVVIDKVMALADKDTRELRISVVDNLEDEDDDERKDLKNVPKTIRIFSKADPWDSASWTLHASASFNPRDSVEADFSSNMDWVQALLPVYKNFSSTMVAPSNLRSFSRRDCYERFKSIGLNYGTVFQGIHTLVQTGDREGFALMDFSSIDNSEEKFSLHPGVLDACFQVLLGVIKSLATAYVPVHIKKISWKTAMPDTLPANKQIAVFARAVADSEDANSITGDIIVMDRECTEVLGRVLEMKAAALSNANANDASQVQRNYATSWQSWKLPTLDAAVIPASLTLEGVPAPVADLVKADHDVLDVACKYYIANALKALPATYDVKAQPLHRQRYLEWCKQTIQGFNPPETFSMEAARTTLGVEAEAIQRVGENMVQLLKDPLSAQKILFSDDLMDRLYKTSTSFAPYVDALVHVFGQLLQHQSALNKRVLRIVEVGAGTGGLTERLIQEIVRVLGGGKTTPPAVRYMFTDISQKFLNDARKKFQEHSWIDYRLLNLETSPSEQAIPAHSIDIVLAFDVLHVASDIDSCLKNVREMLTPGGLLLAIEPTKPPVWMDMYFGLFKEWLNFSDSTRLERGKCTMPVEIWNSVLQKNQFNCLKTLVSEPEFVHGLLIAQSGLNDAAVASAAAVVAADKPPKNVTVFVNGSVEELLATVKRTMTNDANADKIFVVVTRDCQPVGEVARTGLNLADSQRIGFARVVASEYPEADIRIVDVPSSFSAEQINEWVQRIVSMSQANVLLDREIAIRGDDIFVPRLRLIPEEAPAKTQQTPSASATREEHFRLDISTRGQLSTLFWAETRIPTTGLASNDVVVDVHAAAMNFKDLMIALGMITVPTKNKRSIINLGLEFSGKVVAVGASVSHVAVGQEVFGVGSNCFGTRVLTSGDLVVAKPAHLTHVEAASLPIVFATCYSALMAKARIEKDELVLVHSAAGGIGQAAIQLCKKTGSDVIATVSSEEKRQFLREKYGVTKFTDSRDVNIWSSEVATMAASRGGVDVVLNSLKGKAIPAGLECLALGGRFVEIGKVDILRNSKIGMGHLLRDISLHSVQLDIVMDEQQHVMKRYLAAVAQLAEAKDIQPIVDLVVPAAKIEQAFRYMMAGKHKGKIVIDFSAPASTLSSEGIPLRKKLFDADTCYVISGGLGALGWETFKWMAREEGATRFLLLSRSGKLSDSQKSELAALQNELGAAHLMVHVAACDVAERSQVEAAFKEAAAKRVLQGKVAIYHMAMILRDARLTNLTPEMLREAISCKVDGASFLLEFAQQEDRHLDFVLLFSSISSTFGNPDQANYAAGNSYLDALGATLAAQMPDTKVGVINLSGVEDVGVLAEDFRLRQMSRLRGLQAGLTVRRVLEQIRTMLARNDESVQWVFGNFAFKPLVETFPMLRAKCDHLVDYRIAVVSDDSAGKTVVSIETVTAAVARLFAVDAKTIEAQAPLTQLGLDSLLAVELSSTLKKNFDVKFTQMELLGGVSIEKIVARATGAK
eukprot:TRINITY_DN1719_c0_g3_i2.p1 TRINITY_DN1719_c0_g3~~TRINITY_DN1719_c0_g3_i2.p1  ORF type:complete len:2443 (-),score=702.65 TRINITY_DN1719_c0_g3_i2:40-7368(-)